MYPILFEVGTVHIYSYGLMIALGIIAGMIYLVVAGRKSVGLTFDQANSLFLYVFFAAVIGGKLFLFFEDPSGYLADPLRLIAGQGFVFYGSFLLTIPTMLWYFHRNKLPALKMLDVMAVTTCLVHMLGRIGCFLAGCCHGKPTDSIIGVTYTNPVCYADPLNTPLYPTQLLEAAYIFGVMLFLIFMKNRSTFNGQLFLIYLMMYAAGRFVLEFLRGDEGRGFILDGYLSHSQLIALSILAIVVFFYVRLSKRVSAVLNNH
jgi:phosphatidylglycerol:prolipoprotein diacylglycerol transferase